MSVIHTLRENKVSATLFGVYVGLGVALFAILVYAGLGYFTPVVPVGIGMLALWIRYPKFWIYCVVTSFYVYFTDSKDGGSALDFALGLLLQGSLFLWLMHRLLISRQPLFRSLFDYLLFACYLYSAANAFVAMSHGTPFMNWLREWTIGVAILYYFPIREYFDERQAFNRLLAYASIVAIVQIGQNAYTFVQATRNAEYAWQIVGRRSTPFLFLMSSCFFLSYAVHVKKLGLQLLLALGTAASFVGVFLTYSRTAMISILLCSIAMLFFITAKQRLRLGVLVACFTLIPLVLMPFALGRLAKFAQVAVVNRLTSSGKGTKDISVQARFYEYRAVWRLAQQDPISGYGLATPYIAYIPILKYSTVRSYIHNGYLSFFYRFGIIFSVVYFLTQLYITAEAYTLIRRSRDPFHRTVAIASLFTLVCILLGSTTDTVFFTRSTTFVLAFSYAALGIVRKQLLEEEAAGANAHTLLLGHGPTALLGSSRIDNSKTEQHVDARIGEDSPEDTIGSESTSRASASIEDTAISPDGKVDTEGSSSADPELSEPS